MRKISGRVISTKPITLPRAAKLISRFAAVDNGSSPAVSTYLQRAADAFNHLVQFHEKRSKTRNMDEKNVEKLQRDGAAEKSLEGEKGKDSESRVRKSDKKTVDNLDGANVDRDGSKDSEMPATEKKKKKRKKKSDGADLKEEKSSRKKKSKDEAVGS